MSAFEQCNCNTGEWQGQLCEKCKGTGQAAKQSIQGEAVLQYVEVNIPNVMTFFPVYEWVSLNKYYTPSVGDKLYTHAPDIAELQAENEVLHAKLSNIVEISETLCSLIDDITISNQTNSIKAQELYRWKDKLDSIVIQYNSDPAISKGSE